MPRPNYRPPITAERRLLWLPPPARPEENGPIVLVIVAESPVVVWSFNMTHLTVGNGVAVRPSHQLLSTQTADSISQKHCWGNRKPTVTAKMRFESRLLLIENLFR